MITYDNLFCLKGFKDVIQKDKDIQEQTANIQIDEFTEPVKSKPTEDNNKKPCNISLQAAEEKKKLEAANRGIMSVSRKRCYVPIELRESDKDIAFKPVIASTVNGQCTHATDKKNDKYSKLHILLIIVLYNGVRK